MPLQDRAPRLDLSFPVEFCCDGTCLRGHCRNLSASGMLAVFSGEPELWTEGELLLHYGDRSYTLHSRVARAQGAEAGLSFSLRSPADRQAIEHILSFAQAHTHLVGAPPF